MDIPNADPPTEPAAGIVQHAGRLLVACLFSLTVTICLLLLMRYFVAIDDAGYTERPPVGNLVFQRTVPDLPPTPDRTDTDFEGPGEYGIPINPPPGPGDGDLLAANTRTAIPFLRPAPEYPQRWLARGVEGWVLVSFTITETGAVTNAMVLDSKPRGAFDAAALRTIARYKYHPQIIGGKPAALPGVTLRIVFEIDH